MTKALVSLMTLSLALSACTMAPTYERSALPVAAEWPTAAPLPATGSLKWRDLFTDPALQGTIQLALDNNRDLRVAALNIERARALYRIQRADLLPTLDASAGGNRSHSDTAGNSDTYSADLNLDWELDLFGRIRSLNRAALEDFLATQETRKAVAISLIADTADAWLTLAADQDLLAITRQTFAARRDAYDIAQGRARLGAIDDLELNQARVQFEEAREDIANIETQIDQDKAALTLLAGAPLPGNLLPAALHDQAVTASLPVGVPSDVLLNRPDVLAAEHDLKAANANIGAARAAFFPSISLTGSADSASNALGDLFSNGTNSYSYGVRLNLPIFSGGANRAGLRSVQVNRDIALAQYEKAIQSAFTDVSQALAVRARIDERLSARQAATDAAQRSLTLSQARYRNGADSYLVLLDAQRTLYGSQQSLVNLRLAKASNLVALYRSVADTGGVD
ncbi:MULTISPECIES: efflux transporter outer membrane subunit [Asticcacaulis]|uniref:efflux transporter outer membrane subunit n=1 Tax=Asticcacaulis TaxID=76890 RepID=UPI001AE4055D|nr:MULTISPECIES: efflux transporter outer membrane subunit [Asticcacaulis]MBP2161073.1 multidrug efflux system outer membrane protein [Asticcacaulis solisilvae]MDR6802118.1 multidrug efflux system outer membrane protein [Asticcacaulis sp. BE141]